MCDLAVPSFLFAASWSASGGAIQSEAEDKSRLSVFKSPLSREMEWSISMYRFHCWNLGTLLGYVFAVTLLDCLMELWLFLPLPITCTILIVREKSERKKKTGKGRIKLRSIIIRLQLHRANNNILYLLLNQERTQKDLNF